MSSSFSPVFHFIQSGTPGQGWHDPWSGWVFSPRLNPCGQGQAQLCLLVDFKTNQVKEEERPSQFSCLHFLGVVQLFEE